MAPASTRLLASLYAHRARTRRRSRPLVFQAIDSIIYGYDLAHYFHQEFRTSLPDSAATGARPVPYRDDALDL
jgi:hypothetical protein